MAHADAKQGTIQNVQVQEWLEDWAGHFLADRKAANVSPGTLEFYRKKLRLFLGYCEARVITRVSQLTPVLLREFLLYLEDKGHNPGGVHAAFRTVRVFLNWYWEEVEPDGKNPVNKVKAPRVPQETIEPVDLATVRAMLEGCKKGDFLGERDRTLILFLLDTGARAQECLSVDLDDVDTGSGTVTIRQGKGRKPRQVFIGRQTRRALRSYLRLRQDENPALFLAVMGERLTYDGLRAVMTRRARAANVNPPALHDFRRAFALNMLRQGVDVFSLQRLMGHADLQILRRYLAQTSEDLKAAHAKGSPGNLV